MAWSLRNTATYPFRLLKFHLRAAVAAPTSIALRPFDMETGHQLKYEELSNSLPKSCKLILDVMAAEAL